MPSETGEAGHRRTVRPSTGRQDRHRPPGPRPEAAPRREPWIEPEPPRADPRFNSHPEAIVYLRRGGDPFRRWLLPLLLAGCAGIALVLLALAFRTPPDWEGAPSAAPASLPVDEAGPPG